MSHYLYCTLGNDQLYTNYGKGGADVPIARTVDGQEGVLVKGGAGVANDRFVTAHGVVTKVSDEQLAYLAENPVFQQHVAGGYVVVEQTLTDADRVANNMSSDDKSRPLTDADFEEEGGKGDDPTGPVAKTGETKKKQK